MTAVNLLAAAAMAIRGGEAGAERSRGDFFHLAPRIWRADA